MENNHLPALVLTSNIELTKWMKENFDKYPLPEIIKALDAAIIEYKKSK